MATATSLIRVFPASELRRLIFLGNHSPFSTGNFLLTAACFPVAVLSVPASSALFDSFYSLLFHKSLCTFLLEFFPPPAHGYNIEAKEVFLHHAAYTDLPIFQSAYRIYKISRIPHSGWDYPQRWEPAERWGRRSEEGCRFPRLENLSIRFLRILNCST